MPPALLDWRDSTCLNVLDIELDSLTLRACLPYDKFQHITALLATLHEEGVGMSHRHPTSHMQSHSSGAYFYTAFD